MTRPRGVAHFATAVLWVCAQRQSGQDSIRDHICLNVRYIPTLAKRLLSRESKLYMSRTCLLWFERSHSRVR
jgi:hypothetical protein